MLADNDTIEHIKRSISQATKEINKILKEDRNNAIEKRLLNINTNINRFKEVKALSGSSSGYIQIRIKDGNGTEITDDINKAKQLKAFYEELYKEVFSLCDRASEVCEVKEKLKAVDRITNSSSKNNAMKPSHRKDVFTNFIEVGSWIKLLPNKTSAGDDEIPNIVIRK